MPGTLIDSQFAALESPRDEPLTLTLDATRDVEQLAQSANRWWQANGLERSA